MAKPIAIAEIDGSAFSAYGKVEQVQVRKSSACRGRAIAAFYAPGWRPLAFTSIEVAKAKMERHPGFVRWVA